LPNIASQTATGVVVSKADNKCPDVTMSVTCTCTVNNFEAYKFFNLSNNNNNNDNGRAACFYAGT